MAQDATEQDTTAQDATAQDATAQVTTALDSTAHFVIQGGRYGTYLYKSIGHTNKAV